MFLFSGRNEIREANMSRSCSVCRNNGHNSRTCTEAGGGDECYGRGRGGEGRRSMKLFGVIFTTDTEFGVRVTTDTEDSFRKTVSMNNLSQYHHNQETVQDQPQKLQDSNAEAGYGADAGYDSDDAVHSSTPSRKRKRGNPWTEKEHRQFLLGLKKVGRGDWRGISRNFVKSRTPTQVASHAQKYFERWSNPNHCRRRKPSLFDITTDTITHSPMEEDCHQTETLPVLPPQPPQPRFQQPPLTIGRCPVSTFPAILSPVMLPLAGENSMKNLSLRPMVNLSQQKSPSLRLIRPLPILPLPSPSSKIVYHSSNQKAPSTSHVRPNLPLSLSLSLPSSDEQPPSSSSAFQSMSNGDSIISVA